MLYNYQKKKKKQIESYIFSFHIEFTEHGLRAYSIDILIYINIQHIYTQNVCKKDNKKEKKKSISSLFVRSLFYGGKESTYTFVKMFYLLYNITVHTKGMDQRSAILELNRIDL